MRKDETSGKTIVDCAGFEDSRSPVKDVVAAFLNKLILDETKRLKIVIVENFSKFILNEDRTAFLKVLKHVATLLQNNHRSFHNSICVVATKVSDEREDEYVLKTIKVCLEETRNHLLEKASDRKIEIDLLEFLLHNQKFALFRKPAKSGDPWWGIEKMSKSWEAMRKLIFEDMTFVENSGKFNITLSPDSKLALSGKENLEAKQRLYTLLDKKITPFLIKNFNDNSKNLGTQLIDFSQSYLARLPSINKSRKDLIEFLVEQKLSPDILPEFQFCIRKVDFLLFATSQSFEMIAEAEKQILNLHGGLNVLSAHIQEVINYHTLMVSIEAQTENIVVIHSRNTIISLLRSLDEKNFKEKIPLLTRYGFDERVVTSALKLQINAEKIHRITHLISSILRSDVSFSLPSDDSPVLRQFDRYLCMSEIMEKLLSYSNRVHVLVLMATRKLIVDIKLPLNNTHLILMAPVIEIDASQTAEITMHGEDGVQHIEKKAPNSETPRKNGKDGLVGNPGFSSGSLTIFALEIVNPRNLLVRSKGGVGGNGQDGGDGKNGVVGVKTRSTEEPAAVDQSALQPIIGQLLEGMMPKPKDMIIPALMMPAMMSSSSSSSRYIDHAVELTAGLVKCLINSANLSQNSTVPSTVPYLKEHATGGGKGADAGAGASAGSVQFFLKNTNSAVCAIEKSNGRNGSPGRAGKAGQNPIEADESSVDDVHTATDGSAPTAIATNHFKYKFDKAMLQTQINAFILLAKRDASEVRADTLEFIDYVSNINQ